jgi:hypothetical protein
MVVKKTEQVDALEAEIDPQEFDFTAVIPTTKSMHGPKLTLANGSYQAEATAVVGKTLIWLNAQAGTGNDKPTLLEVFRLNKTSQDIICYLTREPGPNTIALKWPADGNQVTFDLTFPLLIQPLAVPKGQRGLIPIEFVTPKGRPALILRFTKVEYAMVTTRKKAATVPKSK